MHHISTEKIAKNDSFFSLMFVCRQNINSIVISHLFSFIVITKCEKCIAARKKHDSWESNLKFSSFFFVLHSKLKWFEFYSNEHWYRCCFQLGFSSENWIENK